MSKLKVGMIGTGGIAQFAHLPAWKKCDDAEVYAICDIDGEKLNKVGDEYGISRRFANMDDLIALDEIDIVDVCTPNYVHMEPTIKALNAGKHVICEKPIGLYAEQGAKMVEAATRNNRKFMVAYCRRWDPQIQAVKRFIDAGEMGEIYYARAHALRRRGIPGWGVFTQKDKQGGGPLIDCGVHIIDLCLWLMGHPKPVSVTGTYSAKFGHRSDIIGLMGQWDYTNYTVEDFAVGMVKFDNGTSMIIEATFVANIQEDMFNGWLYGTEGGCELIPPKMFTERNKTLLDVTPVFVPPCDTMYEGEIFALADAVKNDKPTPVPGEDALMVAKIIDAIYKSSETGREMILV